MQTSVLLTVLVCFTLFHAGLCIDCHQCASKDDGSNPPFCSDPYNGGELSDNIDECGHKDTHCLKSKVITKLNDAGFILGDPRVSVVVTRGCIRADGKGDHCRIIESAAGYFIWCICSGDGCNGAGGVFSSLTVTLLTAAAGSLLRRVL